MWVLRVDAASTGSEVVLCGLCDHRNDASASLRGHALQAAECRSGDGVRGARLPPESVAADSVWEFPDLVVADRRHEQVLVEALAMLPRADCLARRLELLIPFERVVREHGGPAGEHLDDEVAQGVAGALVPVHGRIDARTHRLGERLSLGEDVITERVVALEVDPPVVDVRAPDDGRERAPARAGDEHLRLELRLELARGRRIVGPGASVAGHLELQGPGPPL